VEQNQMMTPRERVMATLRKEPTDKVPFTIYEAKIPQCAVERQLRNEGLCIVDRSVQPYVVEMPNCVTESHTYVEDGKQRTRTVTRTPVGEVSTVREPAGFTSWTVEKLFKGPDDYKVLEFIEQDTQYRPAYEHFAKEEAWRGDDIIMRAGVGAFPLHAIMISWMGIETFALEWMDRRDEILRLEKLMREKKRDLYPILADAPITHANFGGNEVPEVMGPVRYAEFCAPMMQECAEAFNKKGKWVGSHLDGNNKPWAEIVNGSGMHYVEAFTPSPDTDMTLADALEAWPDKVLWINWPSSLHLASIDKIKETTRELIEAAAGTNRVIIGITEDIPEDRWQGNLLAISEVINEMGS
jgi:hypothetical protein